MKKYSRLRLIALMMSLFLAQTGYLKPSIDATRVSQLVKNTLPELTPSSRNPYSNNRRVFTITDTKDASMSLHAIASSPYIKSAEFRFNGDKTLLIQNPFAHQSFNVVDIHHFVKPGQNTLQLVSINGINLEKISDYDQLPHLEINIPYPTLQPASPQDVSTFSTKMLKKIDAIIDNDVAHGFGGAVLLVIHNGKIIKATPYGYRDTFRKSCTTDQNHQLKSNCLLPHSKRIPMTLDTVFDLASLTKMYATNFALMKLVYEGKLDVDKPVVDYIPDFPYEDITVRQVAEHTAGFAPEVLFYDPDKAGKLYSQNRQQTIDFLTGANHSGLNPDHLVVPRAYQPGVKHIYSDTDYMLLGTVIESITGLKLDHYVENEIYKPLGLSDITFNPLAAGIDLHRIAQTAVGNWADVPYPNLRTTPIQGEVQDEKSYYSMNGISGHAGLFGTAHDLAILIQVLLNGGGYGNVKLFDQKTIDLFTKPSDNDETYGLGWRRSGTELNYRAILGAYSSNLAYGHSGFTGMVTLIDPKYNLGIILLTDRLQSQQLSKAAFQSNIDYITPNYGNIITLVESALL